MKILFACLCLAAAAAAVLPSSARADSTPPSATQDYARAVEAFRRYAAGKNAKNAENEPFLLTHGGKTPRSVLMVHGFTDSPYYMRALAGVFYAEGYNVVAILLPGHGTKPEDLLHVKLSQWEDETQFGFDLAARLGDQVSLAGFSTGGALVLEQLAKNASAEAPRPTGDVFLFSPALEINGDFGQKLELGLGCAGPGIGSQIRRWKGDPDAPETEPHRYVKMATNGVCQVYFLTLKNRGLESKIRSAIAKGVGVFARESEADETVDPRAVEKFMDSLPAGTRKDFFLYPKSDHLGHGDVPRPETNPFYGAMAAQIRTFIAPPPSSPTLNALVAAPGDAIGRQ